MKIKVQILGILHFLIFISETVTSRGN